MGGPSSAARAPAWHCPRTDRTAGISPPRAAARGEAAKRRAALGGVGVAGRQVDVVAQPEIQHELGGDAPVVLRETGHIVELLADEADGIDLAAIGKAQQEGGKGGAAIGGCGTAGNAGLLIAEPDAAGLAL